MIVPGVAKPSKGDNTILFIKKLFLKNNNYEGTKLWMGDVHA